MHVFLQYLFIGTQVGDSMKRFSKVHTFFAQRVRKNLNSLFSYLSCR